MQIVKFAKLVPAATFEELWKGRLPDFRARNEVRYLKRYGIKAEIERVNQDLVQVVADSKSDKEITYLEKRGFIRT